MKMKLKILMAVLGMIFLAVGNAAAVPIDVLYTVSGGPGNYLLTFTVDESFATDKYINIFGIDVAGTSPTQPAGWTFAGNINYPSRWYNLTNTTEGDVSGFTISVAFLPEVVNYVVWTTDRQKFTGLAVDPPGATANVPEPATLLLLGMGLFGVAGLRRKIMK